MARQILTLVAVLGLFGCQGATLDDPIEDPGIDTDGDGKADSLVGTFPGSTDVLPADYTGPRFSLKQTYPKYKPRTVVSSLPWASIDPKTDPDHYLLAVRQYCFHGLGIFDSAGNYNGGPTDLNGVRGWYNMPWMHTGVNRREGIHGLTREVDARAGSLAPEQTVAVQDWGVGYYNNLGGYTVGQVWTAHGMPNTADLRSGKAQFPEGAAVIKLLFTSATPAQAPWIDGAFVWQANINSTLSRTSPRAIQEVRLLQVDVAVKDSRASATGWVFGTFVFDPSVETDPIKQQAAGGTSPFHKMLPVGLAWGNDPGVTPTDVAAGMTLKETALSTLIPELAKRTLGWGGRLNGPADNPNSACMSCHGTAESPAVLGMAPSGSEQERLRWFQNRSGSEPFDTGRVALDYSQQMAIAIRNLVGAGGTVVQ